MCSRRRPPPPHPPTPQSATATFTSPAVGPPTQVRSLTELNLLRCGVTNRQAEEVAGLTALRSLSLANSPEVTCNGLEAILRGCRRITRCAAPGEGFC